MATVVTAVRIPASFSWSARDQLAFGANKSAGSDAADAELQQFVGGAGAGQANQLYLDRFVLAGGGSQVIDLRGGTTPDVMRNVFSAAKIVGVYCRLVPTAGNIATHVTVGAAASNSLVTWAVPVGLGGVFSWSDPSGRGLTVTAGTGDQFRVVNSDPTNTADVFLALLGVGA